MKRQADKNKFAFLLKKFMNEANVSEEEFAKSISYANPMTAINRWLKGDNVPGNKQIILDMIKPLCLKQEQGLEKCNNLLKAAGYLPLNEVQRKEHFKSVKAPWLPSSEICTEILDQSALIADKTQNFVGREFVFEAFDQFTATYPRGYFIIKGEPGIGKSSVAAQFVKDKACVHHFNVRAEGINTASRFLRNICAQLIAAHRLNYDTLPPKMDQDGGFFSNLLKQVSQQLCTDEMLIIVLDALDEVGDTDLVGVNKLFLPITLPNCVYLVVTTRPGETLRINCEQAHVLIKQDSKENLTDIDKFVSKAVEQPGIQSYISKQGIDNQKLIEHLIFKSQGNFMYLHYVLPEIEKGTYTDFDTIPLGLQNYYKDHWQRLKGLWLV